MATVAGLDIGAGTAKAVILCDHRIAASAVVPSGHNTLNTAETLMNTVCDKAGISFKDIERLITTGYSRSLIPFAHRTMTEILCHARGAHYLLPDTRTVIDIGCQDSKAIRLDEQGKVVNFAMNDKCAAGTGRFIEVMAHTLELSIEEVGPVALTSKKPSVISSTCTIFAETEIVSLRGRGTPREDLIAGTLQAIAKRVAIMAGGLGVEPQVTFTGGVAKNTGLRKALEEVLGLPLTIPEEPQIVGALGAALYADDDMARDA